MSSTTANTIDVPNLIRNEIDRLEAQRRDIAYKLQQVRIAVTTGKLTRLEVRKNEQDGTITQATIQVDDKTHGLDDEMWMFLQDLMFSQVPYALAPFLGAQGERFTMNVLGLLFPYLERTTTVEAGESTVLKEVKSFQKMEEGTEEGTEGKKSSQAMVPSPSPQEKQLIQLVGQQIPNMRALRLGSLEHRMAHVLEMLDIAANQWEAFYEQALQGGDYTKRYNLRKIAMDFLPLCAQIASICDSAFERIMQNVRQMAVSLEKVRMQTMFYPQMTQQRAGGPEMGVMYGRKSILTTAEGAQSMEREGAERQ